MDEHYLELLVRNHIKRNLRVKIISSWPDIKVQLLLKEDGKWKVISESSDEHFEGNS